MSKDGFKFEDADAPKKATPPELKPKVTTIKVTRGKFMNDGDGGTGAFDPDQRTVPPGYRPKRGRFMEYYK